MTDTNTAPQPAQKDEFLPAKIAHGLLILSFFTGITWFGALIYSYIARDSSPLSKGHLTHVIRTCWISLAGTFISILTSWMLGLGFLIGLVLVIWMATRSISGMVKAFNGEQVTQPGSWGFLAK